MSALLTTYWFCFGFGLVYVLITGTLGAISHGMDSADADIDTDVDVDHDFDLDVDHDVDFDVDHDVDFDVAHDVDFDVDTDADFDADHTAVADFDNAPAVDGHAIDAGQIDLDHRLPSADLGHDTEFGIDSHGIADSDLDPDFAAIQKQDQQDRRRSMPKWSPFSPLSIAGFLAAFGGTGLAASGYGLPLMLTLPVAIGGGIVMSFVLWLLVGKLLFGMMQGSSEARVIDMVGLEAEVITPVESDMSGEIAYVLEGTRYTAPARLLEGERVEKHEKVRICRMKGNMVYVKPKQKLLS